MRLWVGSLALLWLWCRLTAAVLIRPLVLELPYATSAALKRQKDKKKKKEKKVIQWKLTQHCKSTIIIKKFLNEFNRKKYFLQKRDPVGLCPFTHQGLWGVELMLGLLQLSVYSLSPQRKEQQAQAPKWKP